MFAQNLAVIFGAFLFLSSLSLGNEPPNPDISSEPFSESLFSFSLLLYHPVGVADLQCAWGRCTK